MFKIQANASGTRSIEVSEAHLETIRKYKLLDRLVSSNGIVDEPTLDKLKMNVRSMLESSGVADKALLDLCLDVIYNNNMKALGLRTLQPSIVVGRKRQKLTRKRRKQRND